MGAVDGDEDLAGGVDPDLLDAGILEVVLQGAEARELVVDEAERRLPVLERRKIRGETAFVVFGDDGADDLTRPLHIDPRIHVEVSDPLVDLAGDDLGGFHCEPLGGCRRVRLSGNAIGCQLVSM